MKTIVTDNYSFDQFKAIWIDQETDNTDEAETLIEALDECEDFDEIFMVIGHWSHIHLDERLERFLIRNKIIDVTKEVTGWMGLTLSEIIEEFKSGDDLPLTFGDVDSLINIIKAKVKLSEGLISQVEYDNILG